MVKTGYISFITESGAGFDGNGNPTSTTKVYSTYYPCNLMVLTKEHRLLVDGQYLQGNYSIYIDSLLLLGFGLVGIKEVAIQDNHANSLGLFQIQNVEYLDITAKIKIVV